MTDSDVRESIMIATYEALCEHGYTELTAQNIADRTDKSKSLLFYHYDSKEDLVADFVEYLIEWFDERVAQTEELPPVDRLATFVDWFLYGSADDENDERQSFHTAMLELRTQAPYNEEYREQLRKSDDRLREILEEIIQDGIDAGQFTDHDTEETAALLIATLDGARIRQLTLGRDAYLDQVRSGAIARIFDDILVEDVSFPTDRVPYGDLYRVTNASESTAAPDRNDDTAEPESESEPELGDASDSDDNRDDEVEPE